MADSKETKAAIAFEKKNWDVHGSYKYYLPGSYIFKIESIGIYTNIEIIKLACGILKDNIDSATKTNVIVTSDTLVENCYDIILKNNGYTVGKILEFCLNKLYFGNKLIFCGFKKEHPHDIDSYIKIILANPGPGDINQLITGYVNNAAAAAISVLDTIVQQL